MTDLQSAVWRVVDQRCTVDSGFCTVEIVHYVGRQPGHETNSQHSAIVLRELLALEAMGKVRRLDALKPIVWCKAA